jgi:hypothetical protein
MNFQRRVIFRNVETGEGVYVAAAGHLSRISINKLQPEVDSYLLKNKPTGFRTGRGNVDRIFILWNAVSQWKSSHLVTGGS